MTWEEAYGTWLAARDTRGDWSPHDRLERLALEPTDAAVRRA